MDLDEWMLFVGKKWKQKQRTQAVECFLQTRRNSFQAFLPNPPSNISVLLVVFNPGCTLKSLGSFKNTGDLDFVGLKMGAGNEVGFFLFL